MENTREDNIVQSSHPRFPCTLILAQNLTPTTSGEMTQNTTPGITTRGALLSPDEGALILILCWTCGKFKEAKTNCMINNGAFKFYLLFHSDGRSMVFISLRDKHIPARDGGQNFYRGDTNTRTRGV